MCATVHAQKTNKNGTAEIDKELKYLI